MDQSNSIPDRRLWPLRILALVGLGIALFLSTLHVIAAYQKTPRN